MLNLTLTIKTLITLGISIISILSIIGLYYLTKFSFNAKSVKNSESYVTCVNDISNNNLIYCKLTIIILWINFGINILRSIISLLK